MLDLAHEVGRVVRTIQDFASASSDPSRNGIPRNTCAPPGVRMYPSCSEPRPNSRARARGPKSLDDAVKYRFRSSGVHFVEEVSAIASPTAFSRANRSLTATRDRSVLEFIDRILFGFFTKVKGG